MRYRQLATTLTLASACALSFAGLPAASASAATTVNLYVSPAGSNTASGQDAQHPLKTIQAALNVAVPGVTIHLAPGAYHEDPVTVTNGTASNPISIVGTDTGFVATNRAATVLYGTSRIFTINNSYYRLQGFSIEGEQAIPASSYPTSLSATAAFKNANQGAIVDSTLIFVGGSATAVGLTGITINDMYLSGAGGDCVRLRNDANHNQIVRTTIQWCGMLGKYAGSSVYAYHNGEGVYIGTSPSSTTDPMPTDDDSSFNVLQNDSIHTFGSECMDVKENAHDNAMINSACGDNDEPLANTGSNVELRGYDNSVIGNTIAGSLGYGVKMATDSGAYTQGGNTVENNTFGYDVGSAILNNQTTPQGSFCGNVLPATPYLHGQSVGSAASSCGTF
jgi:hypothetical protein